MQVSAHHSGEPGWTDLIVVTRLSEFTYYFLRLKALEGEKVKVLVLILCFPRTRCGKQATSDKARSNHVNRPRSKSCSQASVVPKPVSPSAP